MLVTVRSYRDGGWSDRPPVAREAAVNNITSTLSCSRDKSNKSASTAWFSNRKIIGYATRSLEAISSFCSNLRRLDMSHCSNITLKGVQGILDARPLLKTLLANGRDWFPEELKVEKYRKVNFEDGN